MDVDRSAPVVAEARVEIPAAPDVVFDTIADLERWPTWNPDVKTMTMDGPLAEGTTFRWKAGPGTITSTLRSVEPPRQIGWTGKTLGIHAIHVWRFEARDGHTLASTAESWAGWLPSLLRGPMRKQLQNALDGGLPHLKAEAEPRAVAITPAASRISPTGKIAATIGDAELDHAARAGDAAALGALL